MFSILFRSTRRSPPLSQLVQRRPTVHRIQQYTSFTLREILHESSDEAGTLLTRFAKHIAFEVQKCTSAMPTTIRFSDYFPVTEDKYFKSELKRTPVDQLPALVIFASTYRSNANPNKFVLVLNELDSYAVRHIKTMTDDTIMRTLYALLFLIPNWITRTEFYRVAVKRLAEDFQTDAPKEKFVQLCFYLGLDKKNFSPQNNSYLLQRLINQYLEQYLPMLNTMDLAVVSSAAYKTATAVRNKAYDQRLINEVESLPLDATYDALLVTFIKVMRFGRVRSKRVCERLETICASSTILQKLQARGLVHIFAYFAENLWDRNECIEPLVKEFMGRLNRRENLVCEAENVRVKDVGMFLWCCAQLNCFIAKSDLENIENFIMKKLRNNELRFFPDQLVDCCLSLWLLNYRSRHLLQQAVNLKKQPRPYTKQQRDQPKVDSRLTVLLTAGAIEQPEWVTTLNVPQPFNLDAHVPPYLLKGREDLTNACKVLAVDEDVLETKLVCPIHGINIAGLYIRFKTPANLKVFVELLTDEQTLLVSQETVAILRLKIRLLESLGHRAIALRLNNVLEKKALKSLILNAVGNSESYSIEKAIEDLKNTNNQNGNATDSLCASSYTTDNSDKSGNSLKNIGDTKDGNNNSINVVATTSKNKVDTKKSDIEDVGYITSDAEGTEELTKQSVRSP